MNPALRLLRSRVPAVYRVARAGYELVVNALPPHRPDGVVGPISRADLMLDDRSVVRAPSPAAAAEYDARGRQATAVLVEAVEAAGLAPTDVGSVLDLGCGHGRVLRHLPAAFPAARIVGVDVDRRAADFCRSRLGIEAHAVAPDPSDLPAGPFDVVWMGSVLTHLDEGGFHAMQRELDARLGPHGVLVFSTHSPDLLDERFGSDVAGLVAGELTGSSMAYAAYPHSKDGSYGLAFHTAAFVEEHTPLRLLFHHEHLWSGGHDVWAFARRR